VHGLPLLLATDSHAQRLEQPTEEEQVGNNTHCRGRPKGSGSSRGAYPSSGCG
jgi:hypothetical protein